MGGLSFISRKSDGSVGLIAYHPRDCITWHWSVSLTRRQAGIWKYRPWALCSRATSRRGQWHDYYRLPFGWSLCISRQDGRE